MSSIVPPSFLTNLMSRKSTLSNLGSIFGSEIYLKLDIPYILRTASTAIGDNSFEFPETTFDESAVLTQVINFSLSFKSIVSQIDWRTSRASVKAKPKPSEIEVCFLS